MFRLVVCFVMLCCLTVLWIGCFVGDFCGLFVCFVFVLCLLCGCVAGTVGFAIVWLTLVLDLCILVFCAYFGVLWFLLLAGLRLCSFDFWCFL